MGWRDSEYNVDCNDELSITADEEITAEIAAEHTKALGQLQENFAETGDFPSLPSFKNTDSNMDLIEDVHPRLGMWDQALSALEEIVIRDLPKERKLLLSALVISVIVHGALAVLVLNSRMTFEQDFTPDSIVINLLPSNPLLVEETLDSELIEQEVSEELVEEQIEEKVMQEALAEDQLEEEQLAEEQLAEEQLEEVQQLNEQSIDEAPLENLAEIDSPQPELLEENLPDLAETKVPESQTVDNVPDTADVALPSLISVMESLDTIERENASQFWAYDCDSIEEESDLRTCNPTDRRNYSVVERNATYEALNPVREVSRGTSTVSTVTTNAPELAARLEAANLPEGLGAAIMEQIEQRITLYSNNGNISLENMEIMTEDGAAAEARAIMNDPWVRNQSRLLRRRNVHAQ